MKLKNKIQLLSPAGSFDALVAAGVKLLFLYLE